MPYFCHHFGSPFLVVSNKRQTCKSRFPLLKTLLAFLLSSLLLSSNAFATSDIFEKATHSAVFIYSKIKYGFWEDDDPEANQFGSGFLLDRDKGLVMTNTHVAGRGPTDVTLRFFGQKELIPAERFYIEPHHDIAILKVDPKLIPADAETLTLDCDYKPKRGEEIFAIGHPEKTEFQITRGVVSGEYDDNVDGVFVSTDLVIESGSSGGAAISIQSGKVIGIPTAGWDESDISLLTKAQNACLIWDLIAKGKSPKRPLLGFQQMMEDGYLSNKVGLITNSRIGLQTGDEIISWGNGYKWDISRYVRFADLLRGYEKDSVEIQIKRDGKLLGVTIPVKEGTAHHERKWVYFTGLTFATDIQEDSDIHPVFNERVRLQTRRLGYSSNVNWHVRNLSLLLKVNGEEITSITQLATHAEKAAKESKPLELIFNAPDWTTETWRYLFKRTVPVEEFDTNIDLK